MLGIPGFVNDVGGHGHGGVGERTKGPAICCQRCRVCSHPGQALVGITERASVTGDMFDHAGDTGHCQPLQTRAPQSRHLLRCRTEGAVTNNVVRVGLGHIEHRCAGDRHPGCRKLQPEGFVI